MSDQEEGMDYEKLAGELSKAGLVTADNLKQVISESMKGVKLSEGVEKASGNFDMKDILRHIRDGGCDDENCGLGKATSELYRNGFTRGTYYGVKLGQYAASKGAYIT